MSAMGLMNTGAAPDGPALAAGPQRNVALLLFIILSLLVSMSIDQKETPEVGSFAYWLLIVPSVLLPLTDLKGVFKALFGPARLVLIFGVVAGAWQLMRGDMKALQQLVLMVLVLAWLSSTKARIVTRDLVWLYLMLVLVGAYIWMQSDFNIWGLLPGQTIETAGGTWRISFFPNIANTAVLSLALVLVLTRDMRTLKAYLPVLILALYFLILSFVRTASIALALYVGMRWWLNRKPRSARQVFWVSLLVAIGTNIIIASSTFIFQYLQQFDLIARLFLRSETDLTPEEIFAQLYRPWLWWQHIQMFLTSPSMMGLGAFDFFEVQFDELNEGTTPLGTEALLTRLLATYGLPALCFIYFFIARLRTAAQSGDHWACACFPPVILLMMQWGSVFHPSDANGALLLLIAVHGLKAIVPEPDPAEHRTLQAS